MRLYSLLLAVAGITVLLSGCRDSQQAGDATGRPPTAPLNTPKTGSVILLSQAQFIDVIDEKTGQSDSQPGPARLVILRWDGKQWKRDVIEDPESNTFHKATPFDDPTDTRGVGILTIGAQAAAVKVWYPAERGWLATTLWKTQFGGKWNRFRDFEIGDLTGDGKDDIALVTHDQGVIALLRQTADGWQPVELGRKKKTFVHEAELGDLDGDGALEFYATPSNPNRFNGKPQPGEIVVYRHVGDGFRRDVVERFPLRHVKEILVTDMDGNGSPELYASVEAELGQRTDAPPDAHRTLVKRYTFENGAYVGKVVCTLPDKLCRFFVAGDVDGDGRSELIASTHKSGIWLARPGADGWQTELIDGDSGGFEHATTLADLDGDGRMEIYVAADKQQEVRRYRWTNGKWKRSTIYRIQDDKITWNIFAGRM